MRNALYLPFRWVSVIAVARSITVPTGYIASSIPRAPETFRSPVTVAFPETVRFEDTVAFPETARSFPTTTLEVVTRPVVTLLDEMV